MTLLWPLWLPQLGNGQLGLLPLYTIYRSYHCFTTVDFPCIMSDEFDQNLSPTSATSSWMESASWDWIRPNKYNNNGGHICSGNYMLYLTAYAVQTWFHLSCVYTQTFPEFKTNTVTVSLLFWKTFDAF